MLRTAFCSRHQHQPPQRTSRTVQTQTAGLSRPTTQRRSTTAQKPHTTLALPTHTHTNTHAHTSLETTHPCRAPALRSRQPHNTRRTQQRRLSRMGTTHTHTMHTHTNTMDALSPHPYYTQLTAPKADLPRSCVPGCCTLLGCVRWAQHARIHASSSQRGQQCTRLHMCTAAA